MNSIAKPMCNIDDTVLWESMSGTPLLSETVASARKEEVKVPVAELTRVITSGTQLMRGSL